MGDRRVALDEERLVVSRMSRASNACRERADSEARVLLDECLQLCGATATNIPFMSVQGVDLIVTRERAVGARASG